MSRSSHVSGREAQAICDYAAELCRTLRMPRWLILLLEEPCSKDAQASIKWIDQRWVAQLAVCRDWMKLDYDKRRTAITHEVLHLLHSQLSTVVIDDSAPYMHGHEHEDWVRRVTREFELMVDHLATFMADTHTLEQAWDAAHRKGKS